MAITIRPFKAVRPTRDKVHLVATRSYLSYSVTQLRKKLNENPYSFLHIIHPDLGKTKLHKLNGAERFQRVRSKYEEFLDEGILIRDQKPKFYIYRQTKNNHSFIGIIASVSVDDYLEGRIRIHEQTLSKRQEVFTSYLDSTGINAEPVLLVSQSNADLNSLYERYTAQRAEYDFTQVTKARHELWPVDVEEDITLVKEIFQQQQALYIADGHHRCASSAALCLRNRETSGNRNAAWNFFLAYIISNDNVKVYAFNRLVKDLNGLGYQEFLSKLETDFTLVEIKNPQPADSQLMYLNRKWYTISGKGFQLDAQTLSDKILNPVLGIKDLRKDKRVAFLEQPRGIESLKNAVDRKKFEVAFSLHPFSVSELQKIADANGTMPPKSTWIEPKLRSGMVIYELN